MRWIVCHNPAEAERDAARRTEALTRRSADLDRIRTARARDAERRKAGKKAPAHDVHVRAECALRDHPTLSRWLRQLPSGLLVLDRKKIAAEERLDGTYLLSTSDPDLTAEDVAPDFKSLLEAGRGFRDIKSRHTPPQAAATRSCRSTDLFGTITCPRTAEAGHKHAFSTRARARSAVPEYIEVFCTNEDSGFLADFPQVAVARDLAPSVKLLDRTYAGFDRQPIQVVAPHNAAPLDPSALIVLRGVAS